MDRPKKRGVVARIALAATVTLTGLIAVAPSPAAAGSVPLGNVPTPASASNLSSRQLLAIDGDLAVVVVGTGVASVLQVLEYSDGAWTEIVLITSTLSLGTIPNVNGVAIDDDVIVAGTNSGVHTWEVFRAFGPPPSAVPGFEELSGGSRVGAVAIDGTAMFAVEDGSTDIERYNRSGASFVKGTPLTSNETLRSTSNPTTLAIDDTNGRTLAVGIPDGQSGLGEVEIFQNLAGGLLPTTATSVIANPAPVGNGFGSSVAVGIDGSVAAGYAGADTQQGAAYVFRRVGSALVPLPRVVPTVRRANGEFGTSIALDGDVLLVGEPAPNDIGQSGRAIAFEYDPVADQYLQSEVFIEPFDSAGNDFAESLALTPIPDGGVGSLALFGVEGAGGGPEGVVSALVGQPEATNKLIGAVATMSARFGSSIAISGDFAVVGQPVNGLLGNLIGRVEVLERAGDGTWSSIQEIDSPGGLFNFGWKIALDGNYLVVLSGDDISIYERPDAASPFAIAETISSVALPGGSSFFDVDVSGDTVAAIARGSSPSDPPTLVTIDRFTPTNWGIDTNVTLSAFSEASGPNVAISGDVIAVGLPTESDGAAPAVLSNWFGAVLAFTRTGAVWNTTPASVLRNPLTGDPDDRRFGSDVELDGTTLLVGHSGESTGFAVNGTAWIYEQTASAGVYGTPQRLIASTLGDGQLFGRSVALDGAVAIVGSDGLLDRTDRAHVFTERNGVWTETQLLEQPDFGALDQDQFGAAGFGASVAVNATSVPLSSNGEGAALLVGSPIDSNTNGTGAGAVYWFASTGSTGTDDPTLTIDVTGPGATVTAGASGIAVDGLPKRAIEGYGGDDSNVASTSLEAVDGATDTGVAEVLTETEVGDLELGGAGTDGVGRELIESILLSDIVIEGGWDAALAGSVFAGIPLQNITLGQVLDANLPAVDGKPLSALDLSATPIGSIPIGSIALAAVPIGSIPLPGGQDWCDLLASIGAGYDCTTTPAADPATDSLVDLAIQGTPIGSIPIGSIPIGSIPIGSIPIGSIPIGSIDIAQAPIGSIPIGSIDLAATPIGSIPIGSIPIGSIPIGSIDVGSTPIGSIPIGSITIGEIALGDLTVVPGVAASPIGSIPIGSIDLAAAPIGSIPIGSIPIGSIPIGSIPIGSIPIGSIPIGSIPIASIDLAASPIGSIPIGSIPIGSIPIGSIPIASIPIGSIPIGSIPIGSIPIGSIPIGSIDLAASPIGSIPIASIPAAQRDAIVDCSLIDCESRFDLAAALDAGALLPGTTLAELQGVATGVRLSDLIGVDGLDRAAIEAQLATAIAGGGVDTLADLLTTDDLTLSDLPSSAPQVGQTNVADLAVALDTVSLQDLLAGLGADETALRTALSQAGILELNDLDLIDSGMVLSDLPSDRSEFIAQPISDLLAAMSDVRLGDLLALHPTFDPADVNWGTSTLADLSGWQDVTLAELGDYSATTLAELVAALTATAANDLTFGEVLLSLVGNERHDWTDVKLGSIELENASGAQTFTSGFEVNGGLGLDRTVTIRSTIPDDAVYAAGSTVIRAGDSGTLPGGAGEPTIEGSQLVWTLSGVRSAVRYEIDIDVVSALSLGTNTVGTTGAIVGLGVAATGFTSVGVQQAFEPNDLPTDAGVVNVVSGSIYASHIATSTDVDLFAIDLPAGARLSVALSDLPADYDLVVYGPQVQALAPPLRQIEPSEPPLVTLDPTVNDDGGTVLNDVPLLDRPVVGVSSNRSTVNESIVIGSVRSAGTYYVQVSGYSGASSNQPYALYIASDAPAAPLVCAAQDYQSLADQGTLPTTGEMAGANTLVLVNRERLVGKYGTDANVALDAVDALVQYTNVTNPSLGTNAVVVEVDGDNAVRAAFDAYDAASCEPSTANAVVGAINTLVDTLDAADPATAITQILIVGDDDVIPMARIADDTTIANERTYASTFIDSTANSLFGALSTGHFLSDDPYGDADPIRSGDRILYVTDVGLGRLVETPAEIAGQVAAFIGFEGQLDPSTALVTGYDFLTDGTQAVTDELTGLPDTQSITSIINETWTADDVIDELFPTGTDSPNIASINAHFDHYRALPADQNALGIEDDLFTTADVDIAARQNRLNGRLLFSMGCHGGLSVPDELFPGTTDGIALDWAQAFARQDAIWVGNTGFGYGETEGVELSERLMALYAGRLDGSVNAGQALLYAKQEYLGTQQATYGAFDEKVLQQTVFYGIPFYEIDVAAAPASAPIPPTPATEAVPGSDLRVNTVEVTPSFTSETNVGGVVYTADLPAGDIGQVGDQSTPFAPILPTASFDVSDVDPTGITPASIAQGAVITGLVTSDVENVDPDLARPIVDDSSVETEPRVGNISTDPALFVSSFATPEGPRQSLTTTLSTFRSTDPDGSGTQRLFDELEVETYFRTPGDSADQTRPTLREVRSATTDIGGQQVLVIDALVTDDLPDNVLRVFALVAVDPGTSTEWTLVEMVQVDGDRWSGSLTVGAGDVEYIVQAIDTNGNAALSTNKARGFDAISEQSPVGGPIEVAYSATPGVVFAAPVTLTATAGGAVVDSQLNGGLVVPGSASTVVTLDPAVIGEGAHTVVFTTESGASRTEILLFDDTAPVVTVTGPANAETVEIGTGRRVRYSCADTASGIASCAGVLDGQAIASGSLVPSGLGSKTLVVTATDAAGMSTVAQSSFTVVDTTAPAVSVPAPISASTDVGVATAAVTFTATALDAGQSLTPVCVPASGSSFTIGATTVTCTATDAANNSGQATFVVTVADVEAPVFAAQSTQNFVVPLNAGGPVAFAVPAASDNSGVVPTVVCDPLSGSDFVVGTTSVTCTATDAAANSVDVSFDVVVTVGVDATPPVLTVPSGVSVSTDAGEAFATVTFTATATDDGPAGLGLSLTPTCAPLSGSQFALGDTTVTCTVSDGVNEVSDTFVVTVSDVEAPVFAAQSTQNFVVPLNAGGAVSFVVPSATDNVGVVSVVCDPLSGADFVVGTTSVTCTATDAATNSVDVSFDVVVTVGVDATPPVLAVPAGVSASTDAGEAFATVTFAATATDDGPAGLGLSLTPTCAPLSGSQFALGDTTVTCTVSDGVNEVSDTFVVTVSDVEAPVFAAQSTQNFVVPLNAGGAVSFVVPSATDNVGVVSVVCDPLSGADFVVGTTSVTCTATDAAANSVDVSFDVVVTVGADATPPVLVIPSSTIAASTDAGEAFATVTFTATATDDGPAGSGVVLTPTCAPVSGSQFAIGDTTVTCTVSDGTNQVSDTFTVTVSDGEAPVFGSAATQNFVVPLLAGGPVAFAPPVASDNSGVVPSVVCDPLSGSDFVVGTTSVTCTATDAATNSVDVSFDVVVTVGVDATPPVLTVPSGVSASTDAGEAFATVSFTATATDDGPAGLGLSLTPMCAPVSGSQFAIGNTTVTCSVSDGTNQVSDTFAVTVADGEAPVFGVATDQSFEVPLNTGGPVDYVAPAATDNSGVVPTVVCDPLSGSDFVVGTTSVTCTATDAATNSVDVSFDVVVTVGADATPPVLVVPTSTIEASTDAGEAFATVTFTATSTDDGPAGSGVPLTPTCDPLSGSQFALGDTTVTCTVTDGVNEVSDTFTVTVADGEAPVFAAQSTQNFEVPLASGGVVSFVAPGASDNSGIAPPVTCDPLSGSTFPVGTTEVTCTATDGASNVGTVVFDIVVTVGLDTSLPVVTVPNAAVQGITLPGESAVVVTFDASATDTGPTGTVNVEALCVPASGSPFPTGDTTVTCTATDGAGNTSSESFTVTVIATPAVPEPDQTPPVIELPTGGSISVNTDPGVSFAIVTFEVTATDLGLGEAAVGQFSSGSPGGPTTASLTTIDVTCIPASGSRFSIGTTTVGCSATDDAGNTGTASFQVEVSDVEAPELAAPTGGTLSVLAAADGSVAFAVPEVLDNSGNVSVTCDPASGSRIPAGLNEVTCSATDGSGNVSTVSFDLVVVSPDVESELPATGNSGLNLRPALLVLLAGLALLVASRRRRRLRVTQG